MDKETKGKGKGRERGEERVPGHELQEDDVGAAGGEDQAHGQG